MNRKFENFLLAIALFCSLVALIAAGFIVRAKDGYSPRLIEWESKERLSWINCEPWGWDLNYYDKVTRKWVYGDTLIVHGWLTALGSVPLIWLFLRRKRLWLATTRSRRGECMNCGYDLRASKDRCPECGTAIPPNGKPIASPNIEAP